MLPMAVQKPRPPLLKLTAPVLEQLHAGYEYYRRMDALKFLAEKALSLAVLETLGMVVAGNTAHCRKQLEPYRDAGVDHLLCAIGAGGVPTETARESMYTIGEKIRDYFK